MLNGEKKIKVFIAGGGTGGHVFPAIAVGNELVRRRAEIVFIGNKKGLESELVPKRGWKIEYISSPRWKGRNFVGRILALLQIPFSLIRAFRIISKYRPNIIIGVGGYVSVPVLLVAILRRISIVVMEQNSIPGLANKLLGRFAKRIFISFPISQKYFNSKRTFLSGNPVRDEIREVSNRLPSLSGAFVVMCFGGSQGAKSINEALFASLRFLRKRRHELKFIHQIGLHTDLDIAKNIYEKEGFEAEVSRFISDIEESYAQSHLIICRAGATSIAELMVAGRPAILVPYPFAANDHQRENAKYVMDQGGAVMVLDKDLDGQKMADLILTFMNQHQKLQMMSEAMRKMSKGNAAEVIVDECLKLCA